MGYVDLQQRVERSQDFQVTEGFWHDVRHNPYLSTTVGLILGVPATAIFSAMALEGAPFPELLMPWVPTAALFARGVWQLRRWHPKSPRPRLGLEKQLLMVIRYTGGLTAVEVALESSLTVDEADEILSRLADRGHLLVESRDGALYYALPGRRFGGVR